MCEKESRRHGLMCRAIESRHRRQPIITVLI
jgi:hypothetical protein